MPALFIGPPPRSAPVEKSPVTSKSPERSTATEKGRSSPGPPHFLAHKTLPAEESLTSAISPYPAFRVTFPKVTLLLIALPRNMLSLPSTATEKARSCPVPPYRRAHKSPPEDEYLATY